MTSLIVRRVGPFAPAVPYPAVPYPLAEPAARAARWRQDLRFFAGAYVGGLIFFGLMLA